MENVYSTLCFAMNDPLLPWSCSTLFAKNRQKEVLGYTLRPKKIEIAISSKNYFVFTSYQYLNVLCCNRRYHGQTIHPTQKFISTHMILELSSDILCLQIFNIGTHGNGKLETILWNCYKAATATSQEAFRPHCVRITVVGTNLIKTWKNRGMNHGAPL